MIAKERWSRSTTTQALCQLVPSMEQVSPGRRILRRAREVCAFWSELKRFDLTTSEPEFIHLYFAFVVCDKAHSMTSLPLKDNKYRSLSSSRLTIRMKELRDIAPKDLRDISLHKAITILLDLIVFNYKHYDLI